jgi:hypothetical protein
MVDELLDGDNFRLDDFLAGLNMSESSTEFVKEMLGTQMFHNFVEERRENPSDPEVLFFDDTINAKFNRSKKVVLTGRKKETAFLDDNRSMVCRLVQKYWVALLSMTNDSFLKSKILFPTILGQRNLYSTSSKQLWST